MRSFARRRLRTRAGRVLATLRLRRPVLRVRRSWRSSLLTRVVAATIVLGLVVVLVLGQFLYQRIADGLVDSRLEVALRDAQRLAGEAEAQFDEAGISNSATASAAISSVVSNLGGPVDESDRAVLIRKAAGTDQPDVPVGRAVGGIGEADVPPELRRAVNADPPRQQTKLVQLQAPDGSKSSAILVGQLIKVPVVGTYELYVAFRLNREKELLDVVRRTFIVGGVLLVFLVAGVAYVVTRWVVTPVRQAARTAEELASGRFDRRMRVRGEDDLARLGRAFNEMAASLEDQIHQLEELSRVQRRFVADVSHELRTPLTTIRMAGEVIYESRSAFDPVLSRSAELLQDQLDRFEALLADLLEISRYDAGAAVLEAEPEDMRDVVASVVDGLRPLAERRGCLLRLQLPDDECVAEIDARRVERVVRNLLGNAIEHGDGLPIDVRVMCEGAAVAVGVRDRGVGLRPGELSSVFDRFWRGDPARARTTGGTGLGLAIALEDAHLHGGWLQAWGEPGRGAHFVLTLPRRPGVALTTSPLPLNPTIRRTPAPAVSKQADEGADTVGAGSGRAAAAGSQAGPRPPGGNVPAGDDGRAPAGAPGSSGRPRS